MLEEEFIIESNNTEIVRIFSNYDTLEMNDKIKILIQLQKWIDSQSDDLRNTLKVQEDYYKGIKLEK